MDKRIFCFVPLKVKFKNGMIYFVIFVLIPITGLQPLGIKHRQQQHEERSW